MGTDSLPLLLNSHLVMKKKTNGHTTNWEVALKLYDDKFDPKVVNTPITLQKGARIGFASAYCDNDTSLTRECFVTSAPVEGPDKDQGWRDANVFTKYILK
jgi:CHASE2 domain-containing sensor protein